ncbi:MAG: sugar ABC transporter substrate-binding protein [Clostridiales bacterium]|nr:sugar ABC transporter substrate-binding protein [Clostridiales bacterium]
MKQLKKLMALLLALAMVLALAACGSTADSGGSSGSGASSGEETGDDGAAANLDSSAELEVWIWDSDQQDGIQEICDLFTEDTGIAVKVNVVTWDNYWTLLEAGASGGEMADVFWMHVQEADKYMSNDILLDLTSYIEADDGIDMANYYEGAVETFTYDGKYYGIPKDHDINVLLYNKAIFDEYGFDYPDETWTWETYYEVAAGITEASGGSVYGAAMNTTNDQDGWWNIVYAMGGSVISEDGTTSTLDSDATKTAMEFVGKLVDDAFAPQSLVSENGTSGLFTNNLVAMICQGNYTLAGFTEYDGSENYSTAVLPYYDANGNGQCDDGERVTIYNSLAWSASSSSEHPDESAALVLWLSSYDMQVKQAELGVTLAGYVGADSAYADVITAKGIDASAVQVMNDSATLISYPHSYYTTTWQNYYREQLVNAWLDTSTMSSVLDDCAAYMNNILATE